MPAPAKGTEGKESQKSESNQHPAPSLNDPEGVSVPGCTGPPVQAPHGSPRLGLLTSGGCYFSKGIEWTGLPFSGTFISTSIRTALCSGFRGPNPGDCTTQVQPVGSGFVLFCFLKAVCILLLPAWPSLPGPTPRPFPGNFNLLRPLFFLLGLLGPYMSRQLLSRGGGRALRIEDTPLRATRTLH